MSVVKIKMNTWARCQDTKTKFKRNLAAREGFVDICPNTKALILKEGSRKWKDWDTSVPRGKDPEYISERKKLYSGLCFKNRAEAQKFLVEHKTELNKLAKNNPLFDHWSVMSVIKRFEPAIINFYKQEQ